MADKPETNQLTEFDMSLATLMRINDLIKILHQLSIESRPTTQTKELYLKTLDRVYIESSIKMSKDEKIKADKYQEDIFLLKEKWGMNLAMPFKRYNHINQKYTQGWSEVTFLARQYELFLMKTMERHNMLLKDQKRIEDALL